MSVIRVDNFGPSAGGTTYSARGIAKAWVNFNGTGTIAARDSENVSSLTDNGTGTYVVNLTNAFNATDHVDTGSTANGFCLTNNNGSPTASSASTVLVFSLNTGGGAFDSAFICVTAHGDLA